MSNEHGSDDSTVELEIDAVTQPALLAWKVDVDGCVDYWIAARNVLEVVGLLSEMEEDWSDEGKTELELTIKLMRKTDKPAIRDDDHPNPRPLSAILAEENAKPNPQPCVLGCSEW